MEDSDSDDERFGGAPPPGQPGEPDNPEEKEFFSRFQVVRTLRKTNLGAVKVGMDMVRRQLVCLKMSKQQLMREPRHENPIQECQIMRILGKGGGHPNLCRLIAEYNGPEYHWAVQEFIDGGDFFGFVESKHLLSDRECRMYFRQLMEGLQYMHRRGYCHLDLKPENLLVTADARFLKICDFGMTRPIFPRNELRDGVAALGGPPAPNDGGEPGAPEHHDEQQEEVMWVGQVGTPNYMAPEVYNGRPFRGTLADVYSAGVTLFILLTGIPPYNLPADSDERFRYIYSGKSALLLRHWNKVVHPDAIDLLNRMLCPPDHRWNIDRILTHPWLNPGPPGPRH